MKKKYMIEGLSDNCPLCIEPGDGRSKDKRPPVFHVSCEGGYAGNVCAPHLAALIKAGETVAAAPKPTPIPDPVKPEPRTAQPVPAAAGNGPPK